MLWSQTLAKAQTCNLIANFTKTKVYVWVINRVVSHHFLHRSCVAQEVRLHQQSQNQAFDPVQVQRHGDQRTLLRVAKSPTVRRTRRFWSAPAAVFLPVMWFIICSLSEVKHRPAGGATVQNLAVLFKHRGVRLAVSSVAVKTVIIRRLLQRLVLGFTGVFSVWERRLERLRWRVKWIGGAVRGNRAEHRAVWQLRTEGLQPGRLEGAAIRRIWVGGGHVW